MAGANGTILKTTNGGIQVGIDEKQNIFGLSFHFDPANEKITIRQSESVRNIIGTVAIFGMTGQILIKQPIVSSVLKLNVSGLAAGVYIVRLSNKILSQT